MKSLTTRAETLPNPTKLASRRNWLKGFGTLFGTSLLATPMNLLASPAAAALPASPQVGGDEYVGMVKLFAGTTAPQGWMPCDGRLLPTHEHPALATMLGSTYGGDGRNAFALPNLRPSAQLLTGESTTETLAQVCAIKVANAPATTTALTELRLAHQRRTKVRLVA